MTTKLFLYSAILFATANSFAQGKRIVKWESETMNQSTLSHFQTLAFSYPTPQPLSLIQIYDSVYFWKWDTLTMQWSISNKDINFVYDANHNLTSELSQHWNDSTSAWVNYSQSIFTYDANNNQTNQLGQTWNGSIWVNSSQYISTYNVNNNRTSQLSQSWNGSVWVNSYQYTFTYDANHNLTTTLGQSWNNSVWLNSSQYIFTYDANNNNTSELIESWNGTGWFNSFQYTFTYDANNNRISELGQYSNGTAWVNSFQSTFTYNANNNNTSQLIQGWNGSAWVNSGQVTDTYDGNNFMMTQVDKNFNSTGIKVISGDSGYYYFHTVTGINDLFAERGNISVYPNPTSGKFIIEIQDARYADDKYLHQDRKRLDSMQDGTIEIYNVLGEKIYTSPPTPLLKERGERVESIDLSNHPAGIYFYKFFSENNSVHTGKIVIE